MKGGAFKIVASSYQRLEMHKFSAFETATIAPREFETTMGTSSPGHMPLDQM